MNPISITDSAKEYIKNVLNTHSKDYLFLSMKGGGCAGFEYTWETLNEEEYTKRGTPNRDEILVLDNGRKLAVDCTSIVYLFGSTIDYKIKLSGSMLVVDNPNTKGGCGCGTSVSF